MNKSGYEEEKLEYELLLNDEVGGDDLKMKTQKLTPSLIKSDLINNGSTISPSKSNKIPNSLAFKRKSNDESMAATIVDPLYL
jgi:hypothetical protein